MDYAQSEIFRLLLKHLLKEKIEFPTIAEKINNKSKSIQVEPINLNTDAVKQENGSKSGDVITIKGTVKAETPKALLIEFKPGLEDWIPKSMIKSQYSSQ